MILARKNINLFLNCESGLSEIIAAIMLLAIVVSMIAIIQTQSVPEWNKAVEMDHFNVVYDDFLKIRSDINDVALFQFPKSSVIHMGAHYPGRLIFINPADTSGTLTSTNDTWINMSYTPFNQTPTFFNNSSTSIKFMPNYNYYSNSPSLVYEHGLIIKDFAIDNYLYTDTNQAIFDNNIINVFILAYPQESVSFSGINSLNYNLQSKISTYDNTNVTVTFYTNYPQLWDALLRKYNLNPIVSGNIVTVDYPGNITINAYTFNGSIASGTGVSAITTIPTPAPTSTPTEYNYVFDFLNITGIVTDFEKARNASDGGASAAFYENGTTSISDPNNYTYVTVNTTTNGTIINWTDMQSNDSAYATLAEEANTVNTTYWWGFNTTTESWSHTWAGSGGTVTAGWINDGNAAGGIFSRLTTTSSSPRTRISTWRSPEFTWNGGIPSSASLYFDWKVQTYTRGSPGNYYVQLIKPDYSIVQIYPTTYFSATAPWSSKSTSLSESDFSQSGNYQLKLLATLNTQGGGTQIVEIRWDNPNITLGTTTYSLNITTDTVSVPSANNQYLEINYSKTAADNYEVYVFDGYNWNNRGTLDSTTWTVFNYTLTSDEYNSGTPRVMYIDQDPSGSTQGNLHIDYQRIHGITTGFPPVYHLNITTNTSDIPQTSNHVLEIRYNISGDNFTLQLWNGTSWNNRTTLNDTSLSYRNVTLLPDELILYSDAEGINKYYTLVRYLDMNSATQQGTLYLDYQRIYNN